MIDNKENKINFKSIDNSRETIIKLLRLYDFPEETTIIDQADYQNELDYNLDIEEFYMSEYEMYLDMNLNYFTVVDEVNNLKNLCDNSNHEIVKKSLILAAFSQVESFFKSVIYNNLPNFEKAIENESISELIKKSLDNKLKKRNDRIEIFRAIFNLNKEFKDLDTQYYTIRNGLAHDIGAVSINANCICYEISNSIYSIDIDELFIELINFIDRIDKVENFNKIEEVSYDDDSPF